MKTKATEDQVVEDYPGLQDDEVSNTLLSAVSNK